MIAVAADDEAMLSSIKFSLEVEGFAVVTFPDGQAMLNGLDRADWACIVLDQNMPGFTAMDAVARLRRDGITVPIILTVSLPSAALRQSARLGAIELVEKPLLDDRLIEVIRDLLGRPPTNVADKRP